jgi:hypothetical protein
MTEGPWKTRGDGAEIVALDAGPCRLTTGHPVGRFFGLPWTSESGPYEAASALSD